MCSPCSGARSGWDGSWSNCTGGGDHRQGVTIAQVGLGKVAVGPHLGVIREFAGVLDRRPFSLEARQDALPLGEGAPGEV